jgi:hypothetical protein
LTLVVCVLCLLSSARSSGAGATAGELIAAEAARIKKEIALPDFPKEEGAAYAKALEEAEDALRAGHLFYGLYRVQQVSPEVGGYAYMQRQSAVAKAGAEAFEREWRRMGRELTAKERRVARAGRGAVAVRALAESSLTQVRPRYEAGRLYGYNAGFEYGLFYFGNSEANLDFALFCQTLSLDAQGRAPVLRPLDAELKRLEDETLRAYRRPGASAQQARYNVVNSTLKTASEMNAERRYAGALLKYLDAARVLAQIDAASAEPPALASLKEKSDAMRARLAAAATDHSLALVYWEMARFAIERAEAGKGNDDELRRAGVVLDAVLPRYFAFVSEVKS